MLDKLRNDVKLEMGQRQQAEEALAQAMAGLVLRAQGLVFGAQAIASLMPLPNPLHTGLATAMGQSGRPVVLSSGHPIP